MALPRWLKWTLISGAALAALAAAAVAGGLWYVSTIVGPDVTVGAALPAVAITTLDGAPIDMTDYRGNVLVLDFWSSW